MVISEMHCGEEQYLSDAVTSSSVIICDRKYLISIHYFTYNISDLKVTDCGKIKIYTKNGIIKKSQGLNIT